MRQLTNSEMSAVMKTAHDIGANYKDLLILMDFESGLNPKASNPKSSAKGLIQFIDSTAKKLGYKNSQDLINKHPTFESQVLGPVQKYLKPMAPFPDLQSLAMAIFFPLARKYPPDTSFSTLYQKAFGNNWLTKYDSFKKQNPGIDSIQDYLNLVQKKKSNTKVSKKKTSNIPLISMIFIGNAIVWYYIFKR